MSIPACTGQGGCIPVCTGQGVSIPACTGQGVSAWGVSAQEGEGVYCQGLTNIDLYG